MALADKIADLETALAADIFYVDQDTQQLSVKERFGTIPLVVRMKELLHRDKNEIRRTHDTFGIKYRAALRNWLNGAGDYFQGKADLFRFNTAYEQMLAFYAGRVMDEVLQTKRNDYEVPPEVIAAHNRYWKELPLAAKVEKITAETTTAVIL